MSAKRSRPAAAKDERIRLDLEERREQLVALALATFSKHTYDEVSIDDFARRAKISKGLVYHYFPTKRHLYMAGLREAARQLLEAVEPTSPPTLAADLDPGRRHYEADLRAGIDAYFDFVEARGPAFLALMRGGIGSDLEIARIVEETRLKLMTRVLRQAPKDLDRPVVRVALRGWIGFVEAASIRWLEKRETARDAVVKIALDVFFATVASAVTK